MATGNEELECIGLDQVLKLIPVGRVTLWRKIRRREFPQPLPISRNRLLWRKKSLLEWMRTKEQEAAAEDARIAKMTEI